MPKPKDVLVVTTNNVDGTKVISYIQTVSAHIVAGTNFFNDFIGGITDIIGGRSNTYQKQLVSLYNEAIERIKFSAYEVGGNAVLGLSIDMDEISGKGKSMFMLTAIGTAVILENNKPHFENIKTIKNSIVDLEKLNVTKRKKEIIKKADDNSIILDDDTLDFIYQNKIIEIYPFLIKRFQSSILKKDTPTDSIDRIYKFFLKFFSALDFETRIELLYDTLITTSETIFINHIIKLITELNLISYDRIINLLKDNFTMQKSALKIICCDKLTYDHDDI